MTRPAESTLDLFEPKPAAPAAPFGLGHRRCEACSEWVQQEWRDRFETAVLPAHGDCEEAVQYRMADVRRRVEELLGRGRRAP